MGYAAVIGVVAATVVGATQMSVVFLVYHAAVSYTHLDVYKRQAQELPGEFGSAGRSCVICYGRAVPCFHVRSRSIGESVRRR